MIKLLTEKYQKRIAWVLFFIFYWELAATARAGNLQMQAANRQSLFAGSYGSAALNFYPASFNTPLRPLSELGNFPVNPGTEFSFVQSAESTEKKTDDIGGPSQPEMSSFRSVGTDDMVNLFTGDFSYSIPLLDVGGYPVNLFYNAGITMDQEASWVGLGWNINPGTISRNMRGLPDDYNEVDTVTKVQHIKPDRTVGVTGSLGFEIVGLPISANVSAGIFYNNRRGLGLEAGVSGEMSIQKMLSKKTTDECTTKDTSSVDLSVSASLNLNSQNGMSGGANFSVYKHDAERAMKYGLSTGIGYSSRQGVTDLSISGEVSSYKQIGKNIPIRPSLKPHLSSVSFARSSFTPSIRMPMTRFNQLYSVKFGTESKVFFRSITLSGYINETRIEHADTMQRKPAYGYMYYEKGNSNKNALLDFNRINDRVYTYKTPVLALPVYTYDVFTINGEGTGGSFRGYRGNMGYVRDNDTRSKSGSLNLAFDIGPGDIVHAGVVLGGIYSPAMVQEWRLNNALRQTAKFKSTDSIYQGFYFKNPGEKAIIDEGYYHQLGDDDLIRPYLLNTRTSVPYLASGFQVFNQDRNVEKSIPVRDTTYRKNRDKRSQVITWLTAEEAELVSNEKDIYSYEENVFKPGSCSNNSVRTRIPRYIKGDPTFYRKAHHLSKIDVLETDGRRYEYGIPVYQIGQKEVTFSTEASPSNQLVSYTPGADNSTKNKNGRDGFFESQFFQGYAHSFLLTSILSPDYVDVKGDGITDDDLGTTIKFNYSRVDRKIFAGNYNYWIPYKWRMPADANKANYNEGLKSDSRDDKGLYTYGEKELWYLHSIESKNMVATFRISARRDGKQVTGENGGVSQSASGQRKLDRIDLYTKAEFLKDSTHAIPVKTVFFKYSYKLCRKFNLNGSSTNDSSGKLTLDSVWFSYNGNQRQKKNKYVFKYSQTRGEIITNPDYNSSENDRWGNYKAHAQNPDGVPNSDYPYTLQDTLQSNAYASVWNLEKILLPSGGVIQVQYEADDYAYVQDRRASQMTQVAGFGLNNTSTPSDRLYTDQTDHRFVFFNTADPIADNAELGVKYMQDFKQLLLKLWVLMPGANLGTPPAYEPVVIYGVVKSYGLVPTGGGTYNHNRFYVELEETKKGGSPIMQTVIQFLKDQLPQRAYPGYEVNGDGAILQLIRAVWGLVRSFTEGVLGFEKLLKLEGKCKTVDTSMSFARLNNPVFRKIGGGHRVKRIVIADNWSKMTKRGDENGLPDSYYGQEYDYTTIEEVNGRKKTISSGVASYEPGVGNEENPFREVIKYDEKQFLGPTQHGNIELPAAEIFYPSPLVGYSKVTVRSIHNKSNKRIKSGVGLQQTEFYTTRDFPVLSDFTSFDPQSRHEYKPSLLNKLFGFRKKDYLTLTQGFRVKLNDMNGKMKFQASYAENDSLNELNSTSYHYRVKPYGDKKYKLDNMIPVISGPDGKITTKLIGKEVEVMNDFREHFSYTYSANIPLNGEFFTIGPFPILIPTIFRMAFRDESMFRSAVTMKVINEYGILDSVVNIDKGSKVSTKNLVYDAESGNVLVSRTNNEFKKPVYQFNYPAWWAYTGMEPAYRNIDLTYKNVLFRDGRIQESPHVNMNYFESGDEVFVKDMAGTGPAESPGCVTSGYPAVLPVSNEYRVWAVDLRKDPRNETKEFIFLDRYGNPYNSANATIRIIRSGKRNLSGASAGSIVSLSSPLRTRDGEQWVIIDDTSDVVNAGAVEFKEKWRVNDQFYSVDSTYATVKQVPIHNTTVYPVQAYSAEWIRNYDNGASLQYLKMTNRVFETAKYRRYAKIPPSRDKDKVNFDQNSWIKFDLSAFEGAVVVNASLHMPPHWNSHLAPQWPIGHHAFNQAHSEANTKRDPDSRRFKLSRMVKPWYDSTNTAGWQSIFDNSAAEDLINNYVTYSPPSFSMMSTETVNITSIASNMIKNIGNTSMAPGIKLSYWNNSWGIGWEKEKKDDRTWRYCFNYRDNDPKYNYVYMNLSYYNCEEGETILTRAKLADVPTAVPTGYAYCNTYETDKFCYSVFTKKWVNPYTTGLLGNYRAFRSYVYYGERRESNPAVPTDIRKDGVIKEFEPYWAFGTPQLNTTGSSKWVWNSEITQYNRKGAELENHDPLNRYNAGIYGYQESLPVAVVNNSRLRLSAFDGFEDYFYKDDPCESYCKPSKRHFNAGITTSMLDATEAHTGKYSVKIDAGESHLIDAKVSANDSIAEPDLRIKINSTPYEDVLLVTPKGTGRLRGYYYPNTEFSGTATIEENDEPTLIFSERRCHRDDYSPPPPLICKDISVKWKGKIQVVTPGYYEFDVPNTNDDAGVYINDVLVASNSLGDGWREPVYLTPGTLHSIEVRFVQNSKGAGVYLVWIPPGGTVPTAIPPQHLYPEGQESLAEGGAVTQTVYCEKPDTIQAINHYLIDSFNLVPGKKMVASVWMKKGGADCHCTSYTSDFVVRNSGGTVIASFQPKERVIEGWQQFEAIFIVPESGGKIRLDLQAPEENDIYIDDLRLHPFNANMKSFVYDPVTLRLTAELDENNFASFYEYDDEGTLIRVKKETRAGIKTITETRSSMQKKISDIE